MAGEPKARRPNNRRTYHCSLFVERSASIPFAISPISYLCLVELSRNEKKNINVFGKKYTI